MKKLLFNPWLMAVPMAAADDNGGAGDPPPADPPNNPPANPPADPNNPPADPPPTDPPANPPADDTTIQSAIAQKTANPPADPNNPPADPPPTDPPAIDAETKDIADDDYLQAIKADADTLKAVGNDKMELSGDLIKGMLPAFKAAGVKPEQASFLANALAREQIKAERARVEARQTACKQLHAEAMKAFPSEADWKLITAGFNKSFKPGSPMHYTITHSELGSDPEFLAVMKEIGARALKDTAQGAAQGAGAGQDKVDIAKALGIK